MSGPSDVTVPDNVLQYARSRAISALTDLRTPELLAEFYDPTTNFAGASFVQLEPQSSNQITATDLVAVSMLEIEFENHSIRALLSDETNVQVFQSLLEALPDVCLEDASDEVFELMARFYDTVKSLVGKLDAKYSNPWVTASKVAARKRPALFPVRDRVVCKFLGIDQLQDRAKDWMVFQFLMRDESIRTELAELPDRIRVAAASSKRQVRLDDEPLRLLDAALWRIGRIGITATGNPA